MNRWENGRSDKTDDGTSFTTISSPTTNDDMVQLFQLFIIPCHSHQDYHCPHVCVRVRMNFPKLKFGPYDLDLAIGNRMLIPNSEHTHMCDVCACVNKKRNNCENHELLVSIRSAGWLVISLLVS